MLTEILKMAGCARNVRWVQQMVSCGVGDRHYYPVIRDSWWNSMDLDGAHILSASLVNVIAILDEAPPYPDLGEPILGSGDYHMVPS